MVIFFRTPEDLESKLMEQMTQRLLSSEKVLREEMKQKVYTFHIRTFTSL